MSVLDDLIKIKTSKQDDDVLKMLDEIPVYEKLSVDEKLKDLKKSAATRAKCPMLAAFVDGKLYETILAELVSNIYLQIEDRVPEILQTAIEKNDKQKKQIEILQRGIAQVEYRDVMEYDHETMKDQLAGVFTKRDKGLVTVAIIVKDVNGYVMYHGSYADTNDNYIVGDTSKAVRVKGERGVFVMSSYSVLGNNGYRFAKYKNDHVSYDVMIGSDGEMYLMDGDITVLTYSIPNEERNLMNMVKKDPFEFARLITSIIESVV